LPNEVASPQAAEEILRDVGAIQEGHFLLSSGLHSDHYIQCQRVMQYPRHGRVLAEEIVKLLAAAGLFPEAVVGPALGAVHWELFIAQALDQKYGNQPSSSSFVKAIFAERVTDANGDANSFAIRRGVELKPREKVLVVEDVTTTGGSAKKVVQLVKELGAEPIAVAAIVDRSGGKVDFGLPFLKLITLDLKNYAPENCPLCQSGSVAVKPGSSKRS
jgi:orotate phosphoribosyltransferase